MITKEQIKELDSILDKPVKTLTCDDIKQLHKAGLIRVFELRDLHCKDATTYDIVTFYLYYDSIEPDPDYQVYTFDNLGCTYGATSYVDENEAVSLNYDTIIIPGLMKLANFNDENTLYDILHLIYID